jgi:hypothetical protein
MIPIPPFHAREGGREFKPTPIKQMKKTLLTLAAIASLTIANMAHAYTDKELSLINDITSDQEKAKSYISINSYDSPFLMAWFMEETSKFIPKTINGKEFFVAKVSLERLQSGVHLLVYFVLEIPRGHKFMSEDEYKLFQSTGKLDLPDLSTEGL